MALVPLSKLCEIFLTTDFVYLLVNLSQKYFKARRALPLVILPRLYAYRRAIPNHIWLQFVAMEF